MRIVDFNINLNIGPLIKEILSILKSKKEKIISILLSKNWFIFSAISMSLMVTIIFSSYNFLFYQFHSLFASLLIFPLVLRVFSLILDGKKQNTSYYIFHDFSKEKILIFILITLNFSLFLSALLPHTNITPAQTTHYEISNFHIYPHVYEQKQINHSINLRYSSSLFNRLSLKYEDMNISGLDNCKPANEKNKFCRTRILFYYKNNAKKEVMLSKYFKEKEFHNGLKLIDFNNSSKKLIFEIDRSKLKDINIISLVGLRKLNENESKKKFIVNCPNDFNDDSVNITYHFTNNFSYPVKFEDYLLKNNRSSCKFTDVKVWINNVYKKTDCIGKQCWIREDSFLVFDSGVLKFDTSFVRFNYNGLLNFSTLDLEIYLNCSLK